MLCKETEIQKLQDFGGKTGSAASASGFGLRAVEQYGAATSEQGAGGYGTILSLGQSIPNAKTRLPSAALFAIYI